MKDIAGDGGVIKTILTEGSGWTKPKDQDEAQGGCLLEVILHAERNPPCPPVLYADEFCFTNALQYMCPGAFCHCLKYHDCP